jgi:hypothetical protein
MCGRAGAMLVLLGLVALGSSACRGIPTGPSLNDIALAYATQATTADAGACCCRVVGTATNRNREPVHVTIKFAAFDGQDDEISRILYFIKDFQRGASHQINAAGFVFPCSAISRVSAEVEVRGITNPPM